MARQSECEHDILVYRIVGGSGLDVIEECSECGTRITNESPKSKFYREKAEEKAKKKTKKAEKEFKATDETGISWSDIGEKADEFEDKVKEGAKKFAGKAEDFFVGEDEEKPKRKYTKRK